MARPASQAVAGFYATPEDQVRRIAALLQVEEYDDEALGNLRLSVLDPCAGEGVAIEQLTRILTRSIAAAKSREAVRCAAEYRENDRRRKVDRMVREGATQETAEEEVRSQEEAEVAAGGEVETDPEELFADVYTCELERGRHEVLSKRPAFDWRSRQRALRGDAFRAAFVPARDSGVGLLYLNPPYEPSRAFGREEERFLRRFTGALSPGGVLAFVVPHYAISASADTLARRYEDVACYRFAGGGFGVFKQVVVFAKRLAVDRLEPDPEVLRLAAIWCARGAECPELPEDGHRRPLYVVPLGDRHVEALDHWKVLPVDAQAILGKYVPWHEATRRGLQPVSRVVPSLPLVEVMHRTYEVATPPRPAHIAAGLAAGLFNGQRVDPDDPESKLPALLVKGCFDREWRTVEEKHNKDGDKTGEVQVQVPRLVVTILDLANHAYHTLRPETVASARAPKSAADLTVGDLLAHYGRSLMGVMDRQCVTLYDPRRDAGRYDLVETPRRLFQAQSHAARAILVVLGERGAERSPLLLGEIGSGKSATALVAARSHLENSGREGGRVLVFCPPHLLDSWRNEVAAVFPDADYRVVSSVSDVDAVASAPRDRFLVAVVSREAAKLGHRLEGVSGSCPRCGAAVADDPEAIARRRARCAARDVVPDNDFARYALRLALLLRPYGLDGVARYLPERLRAVARRRATRGLLSVGPPAWTGLPADLLRGVREALVERVREDVVGYDSPVKRALVWVLAAGGAAPGDVIDAARAIRPDHSSYDHLAESLLLLLPPGGALGAAYEVLAGFPAPSYGQDSSTDWFQKRYAKIAKIAEIAEIDEEGGDDDADGVSPRVAGLSLDGSADGLRVGGVAVGSAEAAGALLDAVGSLASWSQGPPCGEPLYQSTPDPRRYPLAKYVVKRHRRTFDFVVLDEAHEAANGDSAQSVAAFRLTTLRLPTVLMTGTVMNGYAESLFAPFQATDRDFQEEFSRGDLSAFVERYGYRKRLVTDREDGEVVAYGTQSDRVERSERDVGSAPGVLPLFLFRYLLKGAVTLHKADLRIDLPRLTQDRVPASASGDLFDNYDRMLKVLVDRIRHDRFDEVLAGKLFGQLAEVGSYLDRATADVGNGCGEEYEARYPESVGGATVTSAPLLPRDEVLPKEALMLDVVDRELREGRRVMVHGWHLGLLPRLARLLQERTGEAVPILYADKVPTAKRQAWIDKNVVAKGARVMVANPVCIQTGLNNLVHFHTIWQHECPACNPIVDRQSIGRIDRIGQTKETRVFRAFYGGTIQEKMHDLLMHKVAISTATDGLDPESALLAAGVEADSFLTGLSLGKALWAMMGEGVETGERPSLRVVRGGRRA